MKKVFLLLSTIFLISCANSEKYSQSDGEYGDLSQKEMPCDILPEARVKEILGIPSIAQTDIYEKEGNFPICFYKWESITFPGSMGRDSKQTVDFPAEASIVLVKGINKKGYDNSVKIYDDGESISRVGDMARYSPIKRQLTFLYGNNLVHVRVRISANESSNKDKAIKLAQAVQKEISK